MKLLIALTLYLSIVTADSSSNQDVKPKMIVKTVNSLPLGPKQEYYQIASQYQQYQQPQAQYVQFVPKTVYVPPQHQHHQQHHQPHMIIIAQPTYVPANVLYGSPTQQLLNYFHNNPQARYQLLHGNYQPQVHSQAVAQPSNAQQYIHHQVPHSNNFQIVAAPTHHYQPQIIHAPSNHLSYTQATPVQQPTITNHYSAQQTSHLNQLAQQAAQQYVSTPIRSTPAIITGFEHFTPEQQAKIKAQLSAHFGSQLTPLQSHSQSQTQPQNLAGLAKQISASYLSSAQSPYYSGSRYQGGNSDFVPSPQVKNDGGSSEGLKAYSKM